MLHTSRKPPDTDSARHRIAVVVLGGTFQLDLAVAIQAFGHRPSVFEQLRDEQTAPYDVLLCGRPDTASEALGYTIRDLLPLEEITSADTVLVPGLEGPLRPHDPEALEAIAAATSTTARCSAPAGCSRPPTCACTCWPPTSASPTPTTCRVC